MGGKKKSTSSNNGPSQTQAQQQQQGKPYQVIVSQRFVACTLLVAAALAFSTGRVLCTVLLKQQQLQPLDGTTAQTQLSLTEKVANDDNSLPPPLVKGEKMVPVTIYTSKHFDTAKAKSTASLFLQKDQQVKTKKPMIGEVVTAPTADTEAPSGAKHVKADEPKAEEPTVVTSFTHDQNATAVTDDDEAHDDEEHLPAGQHLLADIDNVEMAFLDSKKRLADAMVELVYECGLTMLSYHCHRLTPSGVSCAGVLLESHVSFHTWPEAGVITLDLFTCGSTSLLPIVPMVEQLFALQRENTDDPPRMVWSYKRRGFAGFSNINNDNNDFFSYPVGIHGMGEKHEITAFETEKEHTRIRIYDVLHEEKQNSLDRQVYVNGRLKYSDMQQAAAQESMVHPAMLTHANPSRVAVVGGSEGGSIREVLKHAPVEKVVLLEKEPELVRLAKTELARWNDCSDLANSKPTCFDDPRVQLFYADATKWFSHTTEEPFDVIILDEPIYDAAFLQPIMNALKEDGLLVMHLCPNDDVSDSQRSQKRKIENHLALQKDAKEHVLAAGFADSRYYEEVHGGYVDAKGFVVAFKNAASLENWNRNEAQVDLELTQRGVPTVSGESPFKYFDGTTMRTYQEASAWKPDASKMKRPEIPVLEKAGGAATQSSYTKSENNSDSTGEEESCANTAQVVHETATEA